MMVRVVQENHTIGFWKSGKNKNTFTRLSNFGLRLLRHVRAPVELPHYSGFIVEVSQRQRSRGVVAESGGYSVVRG